MVNYRKLKHDNARIALERIKQLFAEAEKNKEMADRYVAIARKIAMKHKVRIPKELKRRFCKHCYCYLTSENSRVRAKDGKIVISCFKCKKFTRIPLRNKK